MRQNFGAKAWVYPQPVFVIGTYNEDGTANAMLAAWGGMGDYTQIYMCLDKGHKTVDNINRTGAFTVAMATSETIEACDYFGISSGHKEVDKVNKAGFTYEKSSFVNAPVFDQLPMVFECNVNTYNTETEILVGEIENVAADESILTNGKIDPKKLDPVTFDAVNNTYVRLGESVAKAFECGKKFM